MNFVQIYKWSALKDFKGLFSVIFCSSLDYDEVKVLGVDLTSEEVGQLMGGN